MIYGIGHSTHSVAEFFALLEGLTETLVDIRSHPTSKWPQFRRQALVRHCAKHGVAYLWEQRLGGWSEGFAQYGAEMAAHGVDLSGYTQGHFPKQLISQRHRGGWTNRGLYDYSWFTTLPEFQAGVAELPDDCAIMCSEALWWRCHRSLVADYIVAHGGEVAHIKPTRPKRETTARFTLHSAQIGDRLHRYHGGIDWARGQLTL